MSQTWSYGLSHRNAFTRHRTELRRNASEVNYVERIECRRLFEIPPDPREDLVRERLRPLNTDINIGTFARAAGRARAEEEYAVRAIRYAATDNRKRDVLRLVQFSGMLTHLHTVKYSKRGVSDNGQFNDKRRAKPRPLALEADGAQKLDTWLYGE